MANGAGKECLLVIVFECGDLPISYYFFNLMLYLFYKDSLMIVS